MQFDLPLEEKSIIKVLGVGGGGGNAVSHMYLQGIKGVDFAICNTDNQAMGSSPIPVKIQLGPELTEGMGAGAEPEVGKQSCIESIDQVRDFLGTDTKMLFVTAGMGGGTGTGAAPIIAKAAKEMGILTVAIVTLPFRFEGNRRQNFASEGLDQLRKNVDSILIINNERLFKIFGNLTLAEAFAEADSILTTAVKGIAEIITVHGYINVDFKDVNTVMKNSGVAIMGSGVIEGEDRARRSIQEAINSPLLENNDIRGAKHILLNISSGKKEVTMSEIAEITDYVQEEAGMGTNVIWGNGYDDKLGEKLRITLIATGFSGEEKAKIKEVPKTERVSLDGKVTEVSQSIEMIDIIDEPVMESDDVRDLIENVNVNNAVEVIDFDYDTDNDMQRKISEERIKKEEKERKRLEYLRKTSSRPLDDPSVIADMENVPAFERRKVQLDQELTDGHNRTDNTLSIDEDGKLGLNPNSFLFDNVD